MFTLIVANLYPSYFEDCETGAEIWKSGLMYQLAFKNFDP